MRNFEDKTLPIQCDNMTIFCIYRIHFNLNILMKFSSVGLNLYLSLIAKENVWRDWKRKITRSKSRPKASFFKLHALFFNVMVFLGFRRHVSPLGSLGVSRGIRSRATACVSRYQWAIIQSLRPTNGGEPWAHHGRGYWGTEAPLWHLGQHRQCGFPHGEHGQGWVYPGIVQIYFQFQISSKKEEVLN